MWQLWHKAVVVNVWRGRISANVDKSCPMCQESADESIIHCFWACLSAQAIWTQATYVLGILIASNSKWLLPK
jgi:hypothetical protein